MIAKGITEAQIADKRPIRETFQKINQAGFFLRRDEKPHDEFAFVWIFRTIAGQRAFGDEPAATGVMVNDFLQCCNEAIVHIWVCFRCPTIFLSG